MSGRSLTDPELADHIEDVFSRHGAAPSQLIFEVTETEAIANIGQALLVRALQDVPSGMGKRTIAEFVGDEPTRKLLRELGIDYGQGFHLGRPLPVTEALDGSCHPE